MSENKNIRDKVFSLLEQSETCQNLLASIPRRDTLYLRGLAGSSHAFLNTIIFRHNEQCLLCIFDDGDEARQHYDDLSSLLEDESRLLYYPELGKKMWSELGPETIVVGRRLLTLKYALSDSPNVIITTASALLEKIASRESIERGKINLQVHSSADFEETIKKLVRLGFKRESRVERPGELSVRGGILDIYLYKAVNPYRIEFFGDQIESIREFDVESQRSINMHDRLEILPPFSAGVFCAFDELPLTDMSLSGSLIEFIDNPLCVVYNPPLVNQRFHSYARDARKYVQDFSKEHHHEDIEYDSYYADPGKIESVLQESHTLHVEQLTPTTHKGFDFAMTKNPHFGGNLELFRSELKKLDSYPIDMVCDSAEQKNRLADVLNEAHFKNIRLSVLSISSGFSWLDKDFYLFTNRELYSRVRSPKLDKIEHRRFSLRQQLSINKGDYVVHTDHGIGIFRGLDMIRVYGKERECLVIEYKDEDKLYVPLEKMHQVQKYSSREGAVPALSKLGSVQWEKLKKSTKKRMKEIAEQLIKLYATRKTRPGYAFGEDTVWQKELEASFPFEETYDQLKAIDDVKEDMQKPRPMDRLVCGDVGYGKTEVAIRAAFKAINDGRQVAILVPTTILAQQHYTTFQERMQQFPVQLELLSRFKSAKQQKEILKKVADGKIDLIVGTHRLLSGDVKFKNLGLLIVDEEQRFGVMHKEKLKLLKMTVDTMSLSATPIPRTMHMALMGAKDMSIINTPPQNRLPIQTHVSRFDPEMIREAILREVDRGGQVFFVHNRVQSIHGIAAHIQEIVPEVSVAVAHGQMHGHELEKVMLRFVQQKVQVLVSTMIIESGIDMPRANTLIVHRADKFGLAQLYQLRGRVGRSNQQAYAYLIIPPVRKLNRNAVKRLQTIQEYSQLGSGYKIAMRDLEIRGAGNIFGAEQSGFVNALGFDLYTKIIREAINELRQDLNISKPEEEKEEKKTESHVQLNVDAYLPSNYIDSSAERVDIYRRLVQSSSIEKVHEIQNELVDRFGPMPEKAQNLVNYILIKLYAGRAGIKKLIVQNGTLKGEFDMQNLPEGEQFRNWLGNIVHNAPDSFEMKHGKDELGFEMRLPPLQNRLNATKKFLQSII